MWSNRQRMLLKGSFYNIGDSGVGWAQLITIWLMVLTCVISWLTWIFPLCSFFTSFMVFSLVLRATCWGPDCGGESFAEVCVGGDCGEAFGTMTGAPVCLSVVRYISDISELDEISEFGGDEGEISVMKILEISFFGLMSVGWFAALSGRWDIRRIGSSSSGQRFI